MNDRDFMYDYDQGRGRKRKREPMQHTRKEVGRENKKQKETQIRNATEGRINRKIYTRKQRESTKRRKASYKSTKKAQKKQNVRF